ncbi:MAG: type II toxin-antitoxin system RelE/ParE family toxin [Syntrophomonas sp.]|uniref:type II toxin-antitoxin system RelE/ParE family toxin n=1 Tax=Syntrophomonas sp. TaxID=2053627 RepID=UPI00260279E3|nr:type II toxin-antitoxin system RelE/ParE family toxin [Syntrophomonas sp.]MDD2510865.1 type II toxin-antitoxin system RelE/ParE family toxin [Syntrophomonas sp.]MDD3879921.1 type II toxin-antitoxin system RelE/ParE family toxin [Syntrophomonas sp.]MDD4627616.1 type II toxin-antitoxin system RelE/ParE family toxin [Syntrophomonas sp.]
MIDYKVSPKAEKYFKKLKDGKLKKKYHEAIIAIRINPSIGKPKKGDLKGIIGYDIYHDGVNYEIAYEVIEQDGQLLIIILAGTRENFYDELKIYLKKRIKETE